MMNNIDKIIKLINELSYKQEIVIVAIDGRCASGKTTIANAIKGKLDCNVIHIDDFFLRPEQRTKERLATAGENIDHERFKAQVLLPLKAGESFSYQRYDCKTQTLTDTITVNPKKINIVEGSYCCNKALREHYCGAIFMTISAENQLQRIIKRDGNEKAKTYIEKWIPLEEKYFEKYRLEESCDLVLQND